MAVQAGEAMDSSSGVSEAIASVSLAEDVNPTQREQFQRMLQEHLPVISTGDSDVGECATTPIQIQLYDETPIYQ